MSHRRDEIGRAWERAAAAYLEARGLEILLRGYRCRVGELDLVCNDRGALAIVEVRARALDARVSAVETIDRHKQRKIVQATRHLLMRHPSWSERKLRFDVIAIDGIDGGEPRLRWIRNAFDAN